MPRAISYHDRPIKLSPRELEVLQWVACGKTNGEIAILLGIAENTIRAHVRGFCTKLDAVNKAHAASIALIHGVLAPGPSSKRVIPLPTLFGLTRQSPTQPAHTPKTKKKNAL